MHSIGGGAQEWWCGAQHWSCLVCNVGDVVSMVLAWKMGVLSSARVVSGVKNRVGARFFTPFRIFSQLVLDQVL